MNSKKEYYIPCRFNLCFLTKTSLYRFWHLLWTWKRSEIWTKYRFSRNWSLIREGEKKLEWEETFNFNGSPVGCLCSLYFCRVEAFETISYPLCRYTPSRLVATHFGVVSLCECHCRIECLVSVLAWNLGNLLVGVGGWRVSCFSKVYIRMINFQGTGSRVLSHFAGEGIGWREKNYFRRCDTTRIHHRDSRSPAQLFIFILFITFRA